MSEYLTRKQRAEKAAREVLDFVNTFGFDSDTFADVICRDHKTLQQSVMRLFIATIKKMAEVYPDSRNEETVELAKIISDISEKYSLPLI